MLLVIHVSYTSSVDFAGVKLLNCDLIFKELSVYFFIFYFLIALCEFEGIGETRLKKWPTVEYELSTRLQAISEKRNWIRKLKILQCIECTVGTTREPSGDGGAKK
ncbi:unnamed protein product [Leptidea sinapis]|uniref:Uncharacterized protein n=1 Tax=Leptidea sinapis TaxID=189913 RepID=A0A5E4QSM9_9NEOP|nr:unnamed protein product [Leptidea sinapis]